jgi:hypothetical protein
LLGHPVPTGEHGVLAYFKYATHMILSLLGGKYNEKAVCPAADG